MLSSSDAVVPSMNVFATVLFAIRDKIFFWARSPMSRALNALSVMTENRMMRKDEGNIISNIMNWQILYIVSFSLKLAIWMNEW